jgi:hypothetical protein
MRAIGRWLAYVLLVLAAVIAARDGVDALRTGAFDATSLDELWSRLHRHSLDQLRAFSPWLTAHAIDEVLSWWSWAVFGIPGIVLALLCRPRNNHWRRRHRSQF